jgi:NhaA family Na+:H+ antiporter
LPIALIVGRPLGLFAGAGLGLALGFHLPHRVGWRELIIIGFVAAMGLSVGLFFAAAILPPGQLRPELSMGVLLSLAGAPLALIGAWLMGIGRFSNERQ